MWVRFPQGVPEKPLLKAAVFCCSPRESNKVSPLRNIVAPLAWSASPCSLFLHLSKAPSPAPGSGASLRPAGGAMKKARAGVLFSMMCSADAERDARYAHDVSCGRDARLRRMARNTSHHCDRRERHHYAVRHTIICPQGQTSFFFPLQAGFFNDVFR